MSSKLLNPHVLLYNITSHPHSPFKPPFFLTMPLPRRLSPSSIFMLQHHIFYLFLFPITDTSADPPLINSHMLLLSFQSNYIIYSFTCIVMRIRYLINVWFTFSTAVYKFTQKKPPCSYCIFLSHEVSAVE